MKMSLLGGYFIIWGFFLKLVIADKAAIVVNQVFDNYMVYTGWFTWIASILYSIQLYADFLACSVLAQGIARLYGIHIAENFCRPYFSASIKDFWKRWHISLSSWLRDYIYIPLGGNRKGKWIKYVNLIITFIISGIWHGAGIKFIIWGCIHAVYQIVSEVFQKPKERLCKILCISYDSRIKKFLQQCVTFFLVNFAWIIFRADSLKIGVFMIRHMLFASNPWVLFNGQIFSLGLNYKEFIVLILAIGILKKVETEQERGICITEVILHQRLPLRWIICLTAILGIMVLGTYGFGFDAQDFIYGGF